MYISENEQTCVCEGKNVDCGICHGRGQILLSTRNSILLNLRESKYYRCYSNPDKFNNYEICFLKDELLPDNIKIRIFGKPKNPNDKDINETYVFDLKTPEGLIDNSIGQSFQEFRSKFKLLVDLGILKDRFQFEINYNDKIELFNNELKGFKTEDEYLILIEYFNFFKRQLIHHVKN